MKKKILSIKDSLYKGFKSLRVYDWYIIILLALIGNYIIDNEFRTLFNQTINDTEIETIAVMVFVSSLLFYFVIAINVIKIFKSIKEKRGVKR